jgi:hypothetical protein
MKARPELCPRIVEGLFGGARTDQHIEAKIGQRVTDADAADWECIRRLNTSVPYDLDAETGLLFARLKPYRQDPEKVLQSLKSYSDFGTVDLDALLNSG